jgi:excinuclease ABC subunit C
VRDEAHRFAITYHRAKRSKALAVSELDGVPGLGPARRATLLRHFGSVRRIAAATPEELALVPGIGPHLAGAVLATLRPGRDRAEINQAEINRAEISGQATS